ncbi:MAG: 4Fe-4S cluster-binding domain-containing protein, partial [Deltaproteobacteria bacterium]
MQRETDGPTGVVFDVQQYCVYDGPGIRTGVFLKGCPLQCFWCHNPESQRPRSQIRLVDSRCDGCGRCVPSCGPKAIR